MQVHPQLFILEVDRKRGRTSRQPTTYVDVLTGMVELSQNGEPLFAPFVTSRWSWWITRWKSVWSLKRNG
mgnify:CR=1 FL=1